MYTSKMTFNSISEIPAAIGRLPHPNAMQGGSENEGKSKSWDGGLGYKNAVKIAEQGGYWPEGTKAMQEAVLEIESLKTEGRLPAIDTDVAGYLPDIDAFLAGDPCHMYTEDEDASDSKPIISIGVAVGRAGMVSQSEAVNRGAAILSVIDDLENQGVRVELWAIWYNKDGARGVDYRTLIKRADEQWAPASAAFALCHAAFSRRLMFRLAETDEKLQAFCRGMGSGAPGKPEGIDIFFKRAGGQTDAGNDNKRYYRTREGAMNRIIELTKHQLEEI